MKKQKNNFIKIIALLLSIITIIGISVSLTSCSNNNEDIQNSISDEVNDYLDKIISDGTYKEIENKWMSDNEKDKNINFDELTDENGTLIVGTKESAPFSYEKDGKQIGLSIDLVFNFCKETKRKLEIVSYPDTDSLLIATSIGKCDIAAAAISITDKRKEYIDFSSSYFNNTGMILVKENNLGFYKILSDFANHTIGVISGTTYCDKIPEINSDINLREYDDIDALFEALENDEVDGIASDSAQNNFILPLHPNIVPAFSVIEDDRYALAFPKTSSDAIHRTETNNLLDDYIIKITNDGTLNKLIDKWINYPSNSNIDYSILSDKKRTLNVAVVEIAPFVILKDNNYVGLSMDILYHFCLENDFNIKFTSYKDIDSAIAAVSTKKADLAASAISITSGRMNLVNFTQPYYINQGSVFCKRDKQYKDIDSLKTATLGTLTGTLYTEIVHNKLPDAKLEQYSTIDELMNALDKGKVDAIFADKATSKDYVTKYPNITDTFVIKENDYYSFVFPKATKTDSVFSSIANSFYKTFIKENRWLLFAKGILNTLIITIVSIIAGTILAFLIFLLCKNGNKAANIITNVCKWIIDGTPAVILLMIFFYIFFASVNINAVIVATIVFTLIFTASFIGILRSAYNIIDNGQFEGSYALGYSKTKTFFKIIFPQMLSHMWGAYCGAVIEHIKATAIVGYIAVQDLTKTSDIIRNSTYEAFFPLISTAILYFIISYLLIKIVRIIQKKKSNKKKALNKFLSDVKTIDIDK